jgi:hypothetical protein
MLYQLSYTRESHRAGHLTRPFTAGGRAGGAYRAPNSIPPPRFPAFPPEWWG